MRYLVFTIGAPGCGKSTWIKNNGLEEYTISPDNLRFLFGSIETQIDGRNAMTLKNDREVWKLVFDLIERRMKTGDLIVVDATHSSNRMISNYKNLIDRYRYRAIAIDFRNMDLETILSQNKMRSEEQHVPDSEIKRIYERSKTMEIPNWVNIYDYKNSLDDIMKDFISIYEYPEEIKQINVFGDIHGCSEELKELLGKNEVNFNDSETINIWVGDYFDRAPTDENLFETFELLNNLDPKRNIFLTGNHENYFAYLKEYERLNKDIKTLSESIKISESKILELEERLKDETLEEREIKQISKKLEGLKGKLEKTKRKLVKAESEYDSNIRKNIPKGTRRTLHLLTQKYGHGEIRKFFRKLLGYTHFKFNDKEYFICHGGFPRIPKVKDKMLDLIKGVGDYGDEEEVIKYWTKNTNENQYLIFGHRDIYGIKDSLWEEYRGCVLNGDAESNPDGTLKCLVLKADSDVNPDAKLIEVETKQETFQSDYLANKISEYLEKDLQSLNEKGIILTAQRHKFIDVKKVRESEDFEIYAINFSNKAFRRGIWDSLSIHARGLFVLRNKKTREEKIISRGYHKFFNTNERPETKLKNLKNIKYPLEVYEKANGYLGLLSTFKNPETNEIEFFITSKTSVDGDFAKVFQELIEPELNEKIKKFLFENKVTAVFEVIEPEFDPHIQKYDKPELVFLNLIKNKIDFELALSIEQEFLKLFKDSKLIRPVKKLREIESYKELIEYLDELNSQDLFTENFIEGAVIREKGASPFMFKIKTDWYKFWKSNRTTKDGIYKKIQIPYNEKETQEEKEIVIKTHLPRFKNHGSYEYQKFVNFLLEKIKREENINKDIISLREEFVNSLKS